MKKRILSLLMAIVIVMSSIYCDIIAFGSDIAEDNSEIEIAVKDIETYSVSEGALNIVKRAKQMTQIKWTPKKDITGWANEITYKAGTTYTGLPYGQPVNVYVNGATTRGDYVPWEITLDNFLAAFNDETSLIYTSYANYNEVAPYYSVDCSGFVSWAWNLKSRQTASGIRNYATLISTSSYEDAQLGDCLCNASAHVSLITDITYDSNGNIDGIEISESNVGYENDYCCKSVRFGKGGTYDLSKIITMYFNRGYVLYRCNTRDSVQYTHSCAVPLEGDICDKCGYGSTIEASNFIKTTYPCFAEIVTPFESTAWSFPCSNDVSEYSVEIAASAENESFTATSLCLNTEGELWYKVTVDGNTGYIYGGDTRLIKLLDTDITISGLSEPSQITEGKAFPLGGIIGAQYNKLIKAEVLVTSGDVTYLSGSDDISDNSYNLRNSAIDYSVIFNDLTVGNYNYEIYVTVQNCYTEDGTTLITDTSTKLIHTNPFKVISAIAHTCDNRTYMYCGEKHPHYGSFKCSICGLINEDTAETRYIDACEICNPSGAVIESTPMYRMYNPNSGEHFYTGSTEERDILVNAGWKYEGVAFNFPVVGSPVHRLYEPKTGEHLYTMDEAEKAKLLDEGWNYEGVAFNSAGTDEVAQYRLHNPNATCGAYHFTGSAEERDILINAGWEYQGIGWYSCIR